MRFLQPSSNVYFLINQRLNRADVNIKNFRNSNCKEAKRQITASETVRINFTYFCRMTLFPMQHDYFKCFSSLFYLLNEVNSFKLKNIITSLMTVFKYFSFCFIISLSLGTEKKNIKNV